MINLKDIRKFHLLPEGGAISLGSDKRREVRLELNAAEPCQLVLEERDGAVQFLCNVVGRETVVFIADGPVVVRPTTDGELWWWSPEGERFLVDGDAPSVTKIATRRARNPELERMMRAMQLNAERRMQQVMGDVQSIVAAQAKELETLKAEGKKRATSKRKAAGIAPAAEAAGDDAGKGGEVTPDDDSGGGGGDDAE